ncbi:hypothetical protein [Anaerobaca lacustris]|uniref:Uncharacterized protein n=1 Tax=Anaerobaca lacustris TaxID=3044600 RepID=A0AAW6U3W4_9BACT|nr:hypothetical protein [Sedimentisphaerales bacterium M17dextr]
MCDEDREEKQDKRSRRKRKRKTVACVLLLLMSCAYLGVFLWIAHTGCLTWIGIVVGTILLAPNIFIAVAGLAHKEKLEKRLCRISLCLGIAILVVLGILVFWPDPPGPWRSYTFDAEVAAFEAKRAVPGEENAALRYEAALSTVDVNDRPESVSDVTLLLRRLSQEPWESEEQPEVSVWLDSHATLIHELLKIGQMGECRWPMATEFGEDSPVPYKQLAFAAQLFLLAGNRDLGEDRIEKSLEKSFWLLRHADHLYQQTHNTDLRIGFRREELALQMIRYVLVRGEASPVDLEAIARHLPGTESTWNQDIARLLRFDEVRFAQVMAPVYEFNGRGQIRFSASAFPFLPKDKPPPKPRALSGKLWKLCCHMNMPLNPDDVWMMARQESSRVMRLLESGPVLPVPEDDLFNGKSFVYFVTNVLANLTRFMARSLTFGISTYASFGRSYAENLTHRRGTWLVLGLRRYRDDHGSWPSSLDAISAYVPAEAFVDPTSGGRFVYALDGNSFRLYSTGVNRTDEGGRARYIEERDYCEDDILIWPLPKPEPRKPQPKHEDVDGV